MFALPFLAHGAGQGMMSSYIGVVGLCPQLELYTWNSWYLVEHIGGNLLHLTHGDFDSQRILYSLTFRQMGVLLFAGYTVFLLIGSMATPDALQRRACLHNGGIRLLYVADRNS